MGKFDKDRYLKQLATQYCLVAGMLPFLEVVITTVSDLTDYPEPLTDIDVLGLSLSGDGAASRTIFDCKSSGKLSGVNRAFWAKGVADYSGADEAFVLLKNRPVHNHRLSALAIQVDLHDEASFVDLGSTFDPAFPQRTHFQASLDNWEKLEDAYAKYAWASSLREVLRNVVPLSAIPWATFRRLIAELRAVKGEFDPNKVEHLAIYLDCLVGLLVLWASIGRDVRRFYDPKMARGDFEKTLRYYLWGGKESYEIRQRLRERGPNADANAGPVELPAWQQLISMASLFLSAPQNLLATALICREVSLRCLVGPDIALDANLTASIASNGRYRQFAAAINDYAVSATGLPRDLGQTISQLILKPTGP